MVDLQALIDTGLTENEAKIYLVLLEEGSLRAGIISRNTGIHRRTVYDSIERLIQKGLISYIKKNNRKYFEPVDPKRLQEIISEKESILTKVMPELEILYKYSKEKSETIFFRGKQGLKTLYDDQIDEKPKEILILASSVDVNEVLKYYFNKYNLQRKKFKIKTRIILDESGKNLKLEKFPLTEVRYIPKKFATEVSINIYNNKTSIILWADIFAGILINQKQMTDAHRKHFEFIWAHSKSK